jgi:hypothetical protein
MQIKIALSFIVIVFSINAYGDLGSKIESLNKSVRLDDDCAKCTTAQYYTSTTVSNMQRCVETLCPDANFSLAAVQMKTYVRAAGTDSTYNSEIQPLVNSIARESAKESLARANGVMNYLKDPPPSTDQSAARLFNLLYGLRSLDKYKITNDDNGNPIIDEKKSRAEDPALSDADFKFRVNIANKFLAKYIETRPFTSVEPTELKLMYTDQGLDARIKVTIAEIQRKRKELMQNADFKFLTSVPGMLDSMSDKNLTAPFVDGNVDSEGLLNLNRNMIGLTFLLQSSTDPEFRKLLESRPIDVKTYVQQNDLETIYRDRIEKGQQALNSKGDLLAPKCRYAYELAQQVLPSQSDLDQFMPRVDPMKQAFAGKTKDLICSSENNKYQNEVASWEPKYPQTKEQFQQALKKNLQRKLQDQLKWRTEFNSIENSPNKNSIYMMSLSSLRADENSPTSDIDSLCDDLTPSIIPDATDYYVNRFIVGPVVISDPKNAKGITFHELGHKLWAYFKGSNSCATSQDWFKNARSCLLENHSDLTAPDMQKQKALLESGTTTKYEEEDWADMISAKVNPNNNFACIFARSLKSDDYKDFSLQNSNDSDVHSSYLFRLLHFTYLSTGQIPEVCNEALSDQGEKANFKNCMTSSQK